MRAVRKMEIFLAILVVGLVILAGTLVLPYIKIPETLTAQGPSSPYDSIQYAISGYRIPTVDQNVAINISLANITPDPVLVLLLPGNGVATGPSIYSAVTVENSFFASVKSTDTQPYTLVISSVNFTTYAVQVKSTWSPYFDWGNYTVTAVLITLVGTGGFLYFRETRKREELEAEVMDRFKKTPQA